MVIALTCSSLLLGESEEGAEGCLRHPEPVDDVHPASVRQDGDDAEESVRADRIAATHAVPLYREPAHEPVTGQHPDDESHAHHPRGQYQRL